MAISCFQFETNKEGNAPVGEHLYSSVEEAKATDP